jgi:hypothetical protein
VGYHLPGQVDEPAGSIRMLHSSPSVVSLAVSHDTVLQLSINMCDHSDPCVENELKL